MPRITIQGPDELDEQSLELGQKGEVLVGRAPDPERLHTPCDDARASPATLTVAAASVSANHLLAWARDGSLYVRDLGSRNGTWLLLPRGQTLCVGSADATVQLSRSKAHSTSAEEPPEPEWSTAPEFARALMSSVERWSSLRELDAEVRVVAVQDSQSESTIPLANGEALVVSPRTTTHANWEPLFENLWRWVARQNSTYEAERRARDEGMILSSPAIRATHRRVVEAAQSAAPVLLLMGPSGAGKELLAEVFHRHSGRSGPFIAVNCALLNKELVRSELFGAEAGSFSGATRRIVGAVERANGGTLFLDEIGELPGELQAMLLRFLDRLTYEPLGHYGKPHAADVNVVVATNKDLRAAAVEGSFRRDLWFRLSVHVVDVPALRGRFADLVAYLEQARAPGATESLLQTLSPEALELLRAHPWGGNFRELANFRQRLLRELPGRLDARACRRLLAEGSLEPEQAASPAGAATDDDFSALAAYATAAFVEDYGQAPRDWDEQKEWNEKYLKPLLFQKLSGSEGEAPPRDEAALSSLASKAAVRARADRGTARKQLARYFQRFKR